MQILANAKTQDMLKKLYALYNRPGTPGEKAATKAAINRINARLPPKERLNINNPYLDNLSDDDLLNELGVKDADIRHTDGSSIFKTKEEMKKRWAKMANEAKNKSR